MICPKCKNKLVLVDVVHNLEENETYRAKRCSNGDCGYSFFTVEYEVIVNQRFEEDYAASGKNREKF